MLENINNFNINGSNRYILMTSRKRFTTNQSRFQDYAQKRTYLFAGNDGRIGLISFYIDNGLLNKMVTVMMRLHIL